MYNLWYFVAFYAVLMQKVLFFVIYAVFLQNRFVAINALLCGENFSQNSVRGEKMTNIRYGYGNEFSSVHLFCL